MTLKIVTIIGWNVVKAQSMFCYWKGYEVWFETVTTWMWATFFVWVAVVVSRIHREPP